MGSVGGLLGTAGGANGTGFSGPSSANIQTPTTTAQAQAQYGNAQTALGQQQAFTNAVAPNGALGLGAQQQVLGQLQAGAAGQGPNPALAQLNQTTAQNVANQTAMMAGQRGASQNAGLMARQAAQQGASTQQQAVGQAATQQAQQQIAYQQALASQANQMVGQQQGALSANTGATQGEQQNILNAIAGQNNANVGMQSNVNNVNGQLANTTMQGQQAMIGGLMNSGSSLMSSLAQGGQVQRFDEGGDVDVTPADAGASAAPNTSTPAFGSDSGAAALGGSSGKSGGGGGGIMALAALAADGGLSSNLPIAATNTSQATPQAPVASKNKKTTATQPAQAMDSVNWGNPGANALYKGTSALGKSVMAALTSPATPNNIPTTQDANQTPTAGPGQMTAAPNDMYAKGGKVPALVSPGERYLSPSEVTKVAKGKDPMKAGEHIPGKPKVGGAKNSYANDTVPKTLEEGGIVLPRSVTQSKNPQWAAHKFVSAIMAKNGKMK